MVTLGLVCAFVSFILLIMGLLAWGAATTKPPQEEPETGAPDSSAPLDSSQGDKH